MPIESRQIPGGAAVVAISGRLVLGRDVEKLETLTSELISKGARKFIFDMSAMDYADSSGIGTLVACLTEIRKAGGELRVAAANARIQRLFNLTGINSMMTMYPSVAEATGA